MRKFLILLTVATLAIGVLVVAGCGSRDEEVEVVEMDGTQKVVDLTEPVEKGIVGVFVEGNETDSATGPTLMTIKEDGTWEGNAWGADNTGACVVESDPNRVTFKFADGTEETWSVMTGDGKVAAIASPDGRQYTKQK